MTDLLKEFTFPEENTWPGNDEIAPYIFSNEIKVIIKVALITRRPILISGNPGCGKTSLAQAIANYQNWSYLKYTFTSRSQLQDLTGDLDHLQRLHDAHAASIPGADPKLENWAYHEPGVLWWGFDPELARRRGGTPEQIAKLKKPLHKPTEPKYLSEHHSGVVILLDEIDKAEPDLPNDLLEPLDQLSFQLPSLQNPIQAKQIPLVLITTNGERELPPAFLRRCITLNLPDPEAAMLIDIAKQHFKKNNKTSTKLYHEIAEKFITLSEEARDLQRRQPSTSEFLDAVKTCLQLKISPEDNNAEWELIKNATLRKINTSE